MREPATAKRHAGRHACCALLCLVFVAAPPPEAGAAALSRAAFDAVYGDPALATLRADLAGLGYSADTLYAVLLAYDGFMASHPTDPTSFSKDALRADLDALFDAQGITDRWHRDILGRMANMFWVELRVAPAWHLRDLSSDGLRDLYTSFLNDPIWRGDLASFFRILTPDFQFQAEDLPADNILGVAAMNHFLLEPLSQQITANAASARGAVEALVFWTENRFFHPYMDLPLGENWGAEVYQTYPLVDADLYYPGYPGWHDFFDLFRERIGGCHLMAALLKALASAINIPVLAGQVDYPPSPHGGHGAAYFRDLDLFAHGDWVAELTGIPAQHLVLDRAAFIQVLADGHAPARLNDDYLDWEDRLRQSLPIALDLRRSAGAATLYLTGQVEVCEADRIATTRPFEDAGHAFDCAPTPAGQETLTGCPSITCQAQGNTVAIRPYAELVPEPGLGRAQAAALLALLALARRRRRRGG